MPVRMKTEWKICAIKTKAVTTRLQSKIINQTRQLWEFYTENFISKKLILTEAN